MTDDIHFTKAELLDRIATGWAELHNLVTGLDESALTQADRVTGWSVADHLVHLAAWERGIAYLLSRRPRHEGMGISDAQWRELTMDQINEEVHHAWQGKPAVEVLAHSRGAHAELLAALADLEVSDLLRDYSAYDETGTISGQPVVGWVIGNTFEHYREHIGYIRDSLDLSS